ncbi:putative quinol monooxygenase [Sphaerisporangium corydalis]|uniref:Quinol monooxygenase n=1 Tax=Sphaerisporangium corydalis TaxID=1441875 RepID=A0ABV9EQ23_9ACTN|nr:putative quinol monooxygenase [Sphaerisporangium corydalis]
MLIVAGKGYVEPEHRHALLAGLEASVREARAEPGCLDYVVAADPVEPGRVNVYERWVSEDHLAAHLATMARPGRPTPAVLGMEIARYEISGSQPVQM